MVVCRRANSSLNIRFVKVKNVFNKPKMERPWMTVKKRFEKTLKF